MRTPVVVAVNPIVSGVVSWALRLRDAMRSDEDFSVRLVSADGPGVEALEADAVVSRTKDLSRYLAQWRRGIFVPNYLWPYYFLGARQVALGSGWQLIGYCHADSAKEYYEPLAVCEPVVSKFIAVSPRCAEILGHHVPGRQHDIEMLPYFVDVLSAPPVKDLQPMRIAYAGRLVQEQKRIFDLAAVLARLEERNLQFKFLIAGEGKEEIALKSLLKSFVDRGCVEFLGKLSMSETLAVWRSAHLFFQCSEFEGTSVSMLEAMGQACVPIISRTESGIDGIVSHAVNGWVFEIGDTRSAADGIEHLIGAPEELRGMSERALEAAEGFAAEAHVERLKGIWNDALQAPVRTREARTWCRRRRIAGARRGVSLLLRHQLRLLKNLHPESLRAFAAGGDS